jgi:hypothetical protein
LISSRAAGAQAMLDMGTGGGEVLASLTTRAASTVATEAWAASLPCAQRRLSPLGIPVVRIEGAPGNLNEVGQAGERGRLPFRDGAFDLISNRHEAFRATEVARVLARGGTFVTQQVDHHNYDDLLRLFDLPCPKEPDTWAYIGVEQCEAAGLHVTAIMTGEERQRFNDVGALIYYLRIVSWAVPSFDVHAYRVTLLGLHEGMKTCPLELRQRRFVIIACKDGRTIVPHGAMAERRHVDTTTLSAGDVCERVRRSSPPDRDDLRDRSGGWRGLHVDRARPTTVLRAD